MALALLLLSSVALAAGRTEWKTKELKEREGGSWRIELAFYLTRPPDMAHVPMKFEFQPTAYYERSMVDGDKLVERTVPLENRQALIESVDVGFMDSGTGKIEKRTRFSFKVTRAHGYEAGEYKVTIRDGRNGQTIGTPVNLRFTGENEVIDRRAMVFTGKKKDAKKDKGGEEKSEAADKPDETKSDAAESAPSEAEDESSDASADEASESSDESSASDTDDDEAGTIKEKPGGCGCRIEDSGRPSAGALVFALGLAVLAFGRRRYRRGA
jgi:MYXO-CTERM domain-containing protein